MKRKILVSSNCQTGGVAATLAAIFPTDQIMPFPLPAEGDAPGAEKILASLRSVDVWVSSGRYDLLEAAGVPHLRAKGGLVRFPEIWFAAFHPDLVYARKVSAGALTMPHYNSAIGLWAYRRGVAPVDAEGLFSEANFRALGYFDRWNASVAQLEHRFKSTDIDVWQFLMAVKRSGLFMHSVNHPMPAALSRLAAQIAVQLGAPPDVLDRPVPINDGLLATIWPVYPAIADRLALHGSWAWKIDGCHYSGVRAYLEFAYASYRNQQIAPDDISAVNIDDALYDRVLGRQLRVAT